MGEQEMTTGEKLDHTLQAYGRLERRHADLKRELAAEQVNVGFFRGELEKERKVTGDLNRMLAVEREARKKDGRVWDDAVRALSMRAVAAEKRVKELEEARDKLADFIEARVPGSEVFRDTGTVVT